MIQSSPLPAILAVFALAGFTIAAAGVRATRLADRLADRTGLGEAVAGGVLLGMMTSLSGLVVSIVSAFDGRASLAFANGVGGIAAQTVFLALADIAYRRANLEHASADVASLFQACLLVLMMSLPLIAFAAPEATIWSVHPASVILVGVYLAGMRKMTRIHHSPMWRPVMTAQTRQDVPDKDQGSRSDLRLGAEFAALAIVVAVAGWALARSGGRIADAAEISETAVGALMTAVVTSLPELVTTLAAVRRGAVQLAMGGIIGGNCFDMLFLSFSDAAYRDGSLYHAISAGDLFWLTIGLAMTGLLLLGMIDRERRGFAGIGFESAGVLVLYAAAIVVQAVLG